MPRASLRFPFFAFILPLAAVAAWQSLAHAESKDAWLGVKPPKGLSDPHRPVVDVKTAKPGELKLPSDRKSHTAFRGERIFRDAATIVGFSQDSRKQGNKVWGRVTGFPSAVATSEWVLSQFKSAGLQDAAMQEYAAPENQPMWWAKAWEVRVVAEAAFGAGTRDVVLESAVPTSGSQILNGPITGALVAVGNNTDTALPDVDVRGKIAVQFLKPVSGAFSERTRTVERAQELTKRGAIAILNVVKQTANMHVRDFGNCGAPCFNLGTADGVFLEQLLERSQKLSPAAPVVLRLSLDSSRLSGLKGHNVMGVVRGKSDEIVIVNAHMDGWYDAAGDNADGLAVLIALARRYAGDKTPPERTLLFVASGGHHSTGLNGPSHFVRMNPSLVGKAVAVLNLEHVAQLRIDSNGWTVEPGEQRMNFGVDNASPAIYAIARRAMADYGFHLNPELGTSVSGDLGGYAPLGVARLQAIHSGPMYHTSGDVLDTLSKPGLERAAYFYFALVDGLTKTARSELNPPGSAPRPRN